jgi:hypothetical protein
MTRMGTASEIWPRLREPALGISDEAIVQAVAGRYARSRLTSEELRDVKLAAFLVEVSTANEVGKKVLDHSDDSVTRLASLGGVSRARVVAALTRLLDAGVLIRREGDPPQLSFAERVLKPAAVAAHIDWAAVSARLQGRSPAWLVLRSVLDAMRAPWNWVPLTYEVLAQQSCYSVGMARHGVSQLVGTGVLERSTHAGRGHEYRCSQWALGEPANGMVEPSQNDRSTPLEREVHRESVPEMPRAPVPSYRSVSEPRAVASGSERPAVDSELRVEIGGLVLRLPVGTEIRMRVGDDGAPIYEVGPHLKFSQGAGPVTDR